MEIVFWFLCNLFATALAAKAATNEDDREPHDGLMAS